MRYDTRLYGVGRLSTDSFLALARTFLFTNATKDDELKQKSALSVLYNGNTGEGLNSVRYPRFCEEASSNASAVE